MSNSGVFSPPQLWRIIYGFFEFRSVNSMHTHILCYTEFNVVNDCASPLPSLNRHCRFAAQKYPITCQSHTRNLSLFSGAIFRFRSSAFHLALSLLPFVRTVTYVSDVCIFMSNAFTNGKKHFLTVFFYVKFNRNTFYFFERRKSKNIFNILINSVDCLAVKYGNFFLLHTKNKWMAGWMNEWKHIHTCAQRGNDDDS